eukprot:gene8986-12119_t
MEMTINGLISTALTLLYIVPIQTKFETVSEVPNYADDIIPVLILCVVIEMLISSSKRLYSFQDTIMSFSLVIVQQYAVIITQQSLQILPYQTLYDHTQIFRTIISDKTGISNLFINNEVDIKYYMNIFYFFFGMLGVDFAYYAFHRSAHELHVIWSGHSVHHSGERYNLSTALRQGVIQHLIGWTFYLPLAVLGLPPHHFKRHSSLNFVSQFWFHTELIGRLPWMLELFLNTPSHHRMHHRPPGNCNYGGFLIIWDRLFGTFQSESIADANGINQIDRSVIYGLAKPLNSFDPLYANINHPWKLLQILNEQYQATPMNKRSLLKLCVDFISVLFRKRVTHKWIIETNFKKLFPDIPPLNKLYVIEWSKIFTMPIDLEDVITVDSNSKDDKNAVVKGYNSDSLTERELEFAVGRKTRESTKMTSKDYKFVLMLFLVIFGLSVVVLKLGFMSQSDSFLTRSVYYAMCIISVFGLRLIPNYY